MSPTLQPAFPAIINLIPNTNFFLHIDSLNPLKTIGYVGTSTGIFTKEYLSDDKLKVPHLLGKLIVVLYVLSTELSQMGTPMESHLQVAHYSHYQILGL